MDGDFCLHFAVIVFLTGLKSSGLGSAYLTLYESMYCTVKS